MVESNKRNGYERNPETNEAMFARDLEKGAGGSGEDPSRKYLRYSSDTPDDALPLTFFENRREQCRLERMIMDELYDEGIVPTREMIMNRLRGNLARGGYARGQALRVDTGDQGRLAERMKEKLFRSMTPSPDLSGRKVR